MSDPEIKQPNHQLTSRAILAATIIIVLSIAMLSLPPTAQASTSIGSTATPSLQPTPTFNVGRLEKPILDDASSEQLKKGALIYWGICMTCHGDHGQGLTDEWRNAFGTQERNCWQSGCHGPDRPSQSFLMEEDKLPPAITGTERLARFKNSQELHDFVITNMPLWSPGSLSNEEAWQVTSFMLELRNVLPSNIELNEANASTIMTQYAVPSPGSDRPAVLTLTGILAVAALGLLTQNLRKTKTHGHEKPNFIHHLHPPTIPALQARLRYTLGAGGLSILLCLILLVTGLLEMFYYIPVPEHAAVSVEAITSLVPFGAWVRNLHFWSAQALMVVMSVHLLRVVLTGAYARHRRLNYLIGIIMLVLVVLLDFTGYVLRWDEGVRWALIVGTNLLKTVPWIGNALYQLAVGGAEPGHSSLERFYTWHIFVLTLAMTFMGVWHIFRLRRDGGVAVPPPEKRLSPARISRFNLVRREVVVMMIAGVILFFISIILPAPIERPITDASIDLHSMRAPWFFLWVQQLLKYGDPFLLGVAVPTLILIGLAILPYVLPQADDHEFGQWLPRGNRLAQGIVVVIAILILILTLLSLLPTAQL